MKLTRLLVLIPLLGLGACSPGAETVTGNGLVALEHATIVDGTGAQPRADGVVVLAGSRILRVGSMGQYRYPGATVVDLKGHWLVPGFTDLHAHIDLGGQPLVYIIPKYRKPLPEALPGRAAAVRQLELPSAAQAATKCLILVVAARSQPSAFCSQLLNKHRQHAFDLGSLLLEMFIISGLDDFQVSSQEKLIFPLAGRPLWNRHGGPPNLWCQSVFLGTRVHRVAGPRGIAPFRL
jgi:hypothetical protein